MMIVIELFGSGGCQLDSRITSIEDGTEAEPAIKASMRECLDDWVLSPGDTIKISEVQ